MPAVFTGITPAGTSGSISATARFLAALVCFSLLTISPAALGDKYASIIIDDLGNNIEHGHDIAILPAALTLAILPQTTYARDIARLGVKHNKEIMLHLPLQSVVHSKASPGTLNLHMTKQAFVRQLRQNLNAVPYIRGVNNHMGSLLTRHPGHMSWLMEELKRHKKLYFVDSKTTARSIADQLASEYRIPNMSRDFFLDPDDSEATLQRQFNRFIARVNSHGYALAIAHPHPKTIQFLQQHLRELAEQNIQLVPVSQLIRAVGNNLQAVRQPNHEGKTNVTCTGTTCTGL